jgi:UDP-hydrolysing UDP-N-acetyl-D-glucosamine 2-epimerase
MRRIGVVTTSRADYSGLRPLLDLIQRDPELELLLFVTAMHLAPPFGLTVSEIESDGFTITDRIDMLLAGDSPTAAAKSLGVGAIGFAASLARHRPDLLVVLGDRFELLSIVPVALVLGIPVAHISGGDETEGALDNQVRHAVTKLSHLHFVCMELHAARVRQMGEEPWRILVAGDPALDLLRQFSPMTREELADSLQLDLRPPVAVVTLHPTTLSELTASDQAHRVAEALHDLSGTLVITSPNADPGHRELQARLERLAAEHLNAGLYPSLGSRRYYSVLALSDVMIGNSSSGIWEAPSFRLPVVNVGERQRGRVRAGNVIDVDFDSEAIRAAVSQALDPAFRAGLGGLQNPYGDGRASERIVRMLKEVELGTTLLVKRFCDQSGAPTACP